MVFKYSSVTDENGHRQRKLEIGFFRSPGLVNPSAPVMSSLARSCQDAAIFPALHWAYTSQPQVNSFREALKAGNLRYFSGRSALGLFSMGLVLWLYEDLSGFCILTNHSQL